MSVTFHNLRTTMVAVVTTACVGSTAFGGALTPPSRFAYFATDPAGIYSANNGPKGVAAVVDGHAFLLSDVSRICLVKDRAAVIDQLVQNYVVERDAAKKGIVVTQADIDGQIALLRKSVAPQDLNDVIAQHHSTMSDVRAAFKHKIQRALIVADQVPAAKMVHAQAILIKYEAPGVPVKIAGTSRDEASAHALIRDIQAEIAKGGDFGQLAAKYSDDQSKSVSGDIGVIYPGIHDVFSGLTAAALDLNAGAIADPVPDSDGIWLVKAISTSADHAPDEDAAYKAAKTVYVDEQSQFLSPKYVLSLIDNSKITYATDSECAPALGNSLPEAAAIVDGHVIPMALVAEKCLQENGPSVVDILVQNYLVDQASKRDNIIVTDSEVDQRVAKLQKLIAPHTIEDGLVARHMTMAELREDFRQEIERTRLAEGSVLPVKMVHCHALKIKFDQPSSYASSMNIARSQHAALILINKLKSQIGAGAPFNTIVAKYAEGDSKAKHGDFGILYPGMQNIDTALLDAGLSLKRGQMTAVPVKTNSGYYIVQAVSTNIDHPKSEYAAYSAASKAYKNNAAQMFVPVKIQSLLSQSQIKYYVHA